MQFLIFCLCCLAFFVIGFACSSMLVYGLTIIPDDEYDNRSLSICLAIYNFTTNNNTLTCVLFFDALKNNSAIVHNTTVEFDTDEFNESFMNYVEEKMDSVSYLTEARIDMLINQKIELTKTELNSKINNISFQDSLVYLQEQNRHEEEMAKITVKEETQQPEPEPVEPPPSREERPPVNQRASIVPEGNNNLFFILGVGAVVAALIARQVYPRFKKKSKKAVERLSMSDAEPMFQDEQNSTNDRKDAF